MSGKTKTEILQTRDKAIEDAIKLFDGPVQIIDSLLDPEECSVKHAPLMRLSEALELLADADAAYFTKGWRDARGCRIERQCCDEYGIVALEEA